MAGGRFTITQITGSVFPPIPDLFGPSHIWLPQVLVGLPACPTWQDYSTCCFRSHMEGRCSEGKATQQATSLAKSVKSGSLAFLSSDSLCKLFLFSFCRPGFIPVHWENKPSRCRGRIKMEIPFKALGLRHGRPARTWHWECRDSSRVCWETKGCVCAMELLWPILHWLPVWDF